MAIPKITHKEEEVLLTMGLLEFPLSPIMLQETVLLDGPPSPSDSLIPACEHLSLAPFIGPSSPKLELLPPVPANPPVELGSDVPPTHEVPENVAPTSLALINPEWESLPKVKEVTTPSIIEFKSFEKEELDPSMGVLTRTRVIYPVIIPRENSCISVPPLLGTAGQVNSLMPCPLASRPVRVDGAPSMTTTPRSPPTPCTDQVKPAPDTPTGDVAYNGAVSPLCSTPTTPEQLPPPAPYASCAPPGQITLGFLRTVTPPSLQLQAGSPANGQQSLVPSRTSPGNLSLPSSHRSLPNEGVEEEEGQFDDVEKDETREPLKLHPSEQPLPPSPASSPSPSASPSRVDQMVQRILLVKRQTSEASARSVSPDVTATAVSPQKHRSALQLKARMT